MVVSWTAAFCPTLLTWLPGEVTDGLAATVHANDRVRVEPVAVSVTVRVTVEAPTAVGVPLISPVALIARPAGSEVGESL